MAGSFFEFFNERAIGLSAMLSPLYNQGAEVEDIEGYRQRLKTVRRKTPTTVREEPTHKVNAAEVSAAEAEDSIECYRQRLKMLRRKTLATVREEPTSTLMVATCSDQNLEADLQSKLLTDSESISTNEPQSDPESDDTDQIDDADKSLDDHGDQTDEKALINFDSSMQWPPSLAGLPGADPDSMRPHLGPRGGLIVQPRRPSMPKAAPTPTL